MNVILQSVQTVKEFFNAMADNLDEGLLPGDPPREVSSDGLGSIKVQHTTLESAVATSSKPGAPTFDPGSSLADLYKGPRKCGQGKTCSGVVLELLQYDTNLITENENQRNHDVEVDNSQVWYPCFLLSTKEKKIRVNCPRTCSLGSMIRFRSLGVLGSWCVKEADEFLTRVDSSVLLMHSNPSDHRSLILTQNASLEGDVFWFHKNEAVTSI